MLFIRAAGLVMLICVHVIGGAAFFRRFFPRESVWWGFFLPTLTLIAALNFIEHFVPVSNLAWLLPISTGAMIWCITRSPEARRGLLLPSALFVATFTFALIMKCLQPNVNFFNTEGLTDLTRIMEFCLGGRVPAIDCWLPPYPHTGYYTFMHYGASVMKRLLWIDVGTAYNLGSALTTSLGLLAGAATAHSLSRRRTWITIATLVLLASACTGSTPIKAVLHPWAPNPVSSIDVGAGWEYPYSEGHNEFSSILKWVPPEMGYRFYTPGCYLYYSEFHATIAGHLLALLTVFGAVELFKRRRTNVPWVILFVVPGFTVITCPWFFFLVTLLAWPALVLAWIVGRRPRGMSFVLTSAGIVLGLLWPTLESLTESAIPQPVHFYTNWNHDLVMILLQCWPIYLPWLALCLVWKRMPFVGQCIHLWLVPAFAFVEIVFFDDRQTTLEKTLGGFYGMSVVTLIPLLFMQRGWGFRGLSGVLMLAGTISLGAWVYCQWVDCYVDGPFMHLEGDTFIKQNPQTVEMEGVLGNIRGKTVLAGKNTVAFFEGPCLPAFTENRCYIGWTNAEESCGHPVEAHQRAQQNNAFYDGTILAPLTFLRDNDIAAVLVLPTDKLSDAWLFKTKAQLGSDYAYFDCKGEGPDNAGVFMLKQH